MSVNRSIRRAAEKKAVRSGTSPVKLLNSLSNLDGIATLSTKLEEFLVASKKMEAIAERLDDIEAISEAQAAAVTLRDNFESLLKRQCLHEEVLFALIDNLRCTIANPTELSSKDLDYWESKLKEAHGGQ
jgi:hypothetical protein